MKKDLVIRYDISYYKDNEDEGMSIPSERETRTRVT